MSPGDVPNTQPYLPINPIQFLFSSTSLPRATQRFDDEFAPGAPPPSPTNRQLHDVPRRRHHTRRLLTFIGPSFPSLGDESGPEAHREEKLAWLLEYLATSS